MHDFKNSFELHVALHVIYNLIKSLGESIQPFTQEMQLNDTI